MNFILSISPEDYNSSLLEKGGFAEALGFGFEILLLGMLTIFAVLAIIWLCLLIFKSVFSAKKVNDNAENITEPAPTTPLAEAAANDAEVVAAIAAAIAMAESENANIKFRVVSFRKK